MEKKYHYLYKITNILNDRYYIGVHNTDDLDDGYLGSGIAILNAIKKYGKENFKKEILKFFDTADEAFEYESKIVNEDLIKDPMSYNMQLGGIHYEHSGYIVIKDESSPTGYSSLSKFSDEYKNNSYTSQIKGKTIVRTDHGNKWVDIETAKKLSLPGIRKGMVTVIDEDGKYINVSINDEKYLSNKYKQINTGYVIVKDENGNIYRVSTNDPRYISGELKYIFKNTVVVRENGKNIRVSTNDPRYISGELKSSVKNRTCYKDKYGNKIYTTIDDPRVLSGELVGITKGYKRSEEAKSKFKKSMGKRCFINDGISQTKLVKIEEVTYYLDNGWQKGMMKKQ